MFVRPVVAVLLVVLALAARPPRAGAQGAPSGAVPLDELGAYRDTLDARAAQPFRLRAFVRPGSLRLYADGARLDASAYRLDDRSGDLWVDVPPPGARTLVAVYHTWPFEAVYRRRAITAPDSGAATVVEAGPEETVPADPFGNARLQRSGSITRGIIAGSGRDVSVESGLNMQLAGEVAPGVQVQAALTDENTPIQPEGTTQRLSEFDRVYIGLDADAGTARLGDIDVAFTESVFARYARKLQGAAVMARLPAAGRFAGGAVTTAGAASRGLFRRQAIPALEGVQGPYRLEGAAGEQFIIVVAGSERVFLDGVLAERGASNDYVIDYQTGELTFTPQVLISDERRIVVEFQYTTSEYSRTTVGSRAEAGFWPRADGTARAGLAATFIREADARRLNTELGFSPEDSLLIAGAGDGVASRSGAQPVVFDPEAPYVQYLREPRTRPDGSVDTVFVPVETVPAEGTTVYRVSFTRVGAGEGSYVRVGRSINGLLFEYRGPGLGDYEPIRILPTPRAQRLVGVQGRVSPMRGVEVFGEWARSVLDANRLSPLDGGDDGGGARLAGIRLAAVPVEIGGATLGRLSGEARHRGVAATFAPFERVRPVEFERRWNLLSRTPGGLGDVEPAEERLDEATLRLDGAPGTFVEAEAGRLALGETFEGWRGAGAVGLETAHVGVDYAASLVGSTDRREGETGAWLKQGGRVEVPVFGRRLVPNLAFAHEHLRQRVIGTDSLVAFPTTEQFVEVRPGVALVTETVTAGGSVEVRTERDVGGGVLRDAGRAYTVRGTFDLQSAGPFSADADVGYRLRRVTDYFRLNEGRADNGSVAVRLNARWAPWSRAVDAGLFYEAQTERTPTLQELYVRTGPELGEYVWEDADGDGLVQVDEFVPERTPTEGTYVRTYVPSDTLAPTVGVQARLTVGLDPARRWRDADARWKRRLADVQTRTTLEVLEKSRDDAVTRLYLLDLSRFRRPGTTINGRLRIVQEVNLFRRVPAYGVDLRGDVLRALTELTSGEEARAQQTLQASGYYRFGEHGAVRLRTEAGRNRATSDAYASRRYDIRSVSVAPEATWNPSRALQATLGAAYAWKDDAVGARQARVFKLPLEARYSLVRRLNLSARGEVARVLLDGEATGLARYELTDGRGPGTSFLWNVFAQYTLNAYLSATLSYDGRAPSDAPTLHTVRVQLSATF